MRARLVAGNWKMHGSRQANADLLDALLAGLGKQGVPQSCECAVCVPFPYLEQVAARLAGSPLAWGVANKFSAAQAGGLVPILCVGETLEAREAGRTEAVVAAQLDAVLATASAAAFVRAVVAYEPVWAIGTGKTASAEQAQAVHAFLRGRLAKQDAAVAQGVRILYGGSVKAANAAALFAMPDVDGGLIGGASLVADEFLAIAAAAQAQPAST
ncbi:MAG: triose-phosphate isomerase [bacterium]